MKNPLAKSANIFVGILCIIVFGTLVILYINTCYHKKYDKSHKFLLFCIDKSGEWTETTSVLECDSFQMTGSNKADMWVNGTKNHVEAGLISIEANNK